MKSKFWGIRDAGRVGAQQFVMLANANGSSSCRLFDSRSGALFSYNTSKGSGTYDTAYRSIFQESRELVPPPGVKTSELEAGLPPHHLAFLQQQVGIEGSSVVARDPPPSGHGMLAGTQELINEALQLDDVSFDTKTAAQRLSGSPILLNSASLLDRMYERIVRNWDRSECRSTELWRSIAKTSIAAHNASPEKTLEKAIAEWAQGWFNQIPAASGLLAGVEEKHRNVDLGHFLAPGHLELIELKAGPHADTPLKAAFEIVGYGLLYCFARAHRSQLALPRAHRVLDAGRVDLKVLAPVEVYAGYSLRWLGLSLDSGFQQFCRRWFAELEMRFAFESFQEDFRWPGTEHYKLPEILERRVPVAWK
ncbi:MAG: hypothetical protein IPP47_14350 [Bryobacterales bacterium]|nr:hypothetical protein [Bryobacterales bacterium]